MAVQAPDPQTAVYAVHLAELSAGDTDRVGAKAANLGELMRVGLNVPSGFAVTTNAFARFLEHNGLDRNSTAEAVEAAPLPPDLAAALVSAARTLGDVPVAVRSSGVAEDLPGASFAGQYESFLNVQGEPSLLDAIRRCWASAFNQRVSAYKSNREWSGQFGMAVLVQQMVPADAAGVAFTANPVTGNRNETVVSAVRGLGERLVSGEASPDEWVINGQEAVARATPEQAIGAEQVLAVADLARKVEAHYGSPQDVEWAIAGGTLYLLQARPITALPEAPPEPVPVEIAPPPGFWEREASHFPRPLSPMAASIVTPIENASMKRVFDEFSLLLETLEYRQIGGWLYTRLVPLGGKDRPAPPAWLFSILIRAVPSIRRRIRGSVDAMRSDKAGKLIDRWNAEWQPALSRRMAELRDVDLPRLSDEELEQHLDRAMAHFTEAAGIHFILHAPGVFALAELTFTCRDMLGWDEVRTLDLVAGLSTMSTEPARRLAELARLARDRPAVRSVLEHVDSTTARRLVEVDPEFATAFAEYQSAYGCRALSYDLEDPSIAETPELTLGLLADQLAWNYDPAADTASLHAHRTAVTAEARAALAGHSAEDRARFERVLERAQRTYPVREENEFYTISAPIALLRYALLELGRRLAKQGQIQRAEHVFYLRYDEARAALRDRTDRQKLVTQRRGERAWVLANPGPPSYGKNPGPPPPLDALPPEPRFAMQALLWFTDHTFASEATAHATQVGEELRGIAASQGAYTGPARVIMNESEFGKIQAGDVLVCPITSPVWSVLLPSVGALVTDTGGILSHAAIIAREYRVPAVVATGKATALLHDGQIVSVDGASGVVRLV